MFQLSGRISLLLVATMLMLSAVATSARADTVNRYLYVSGQVFAPNEGHGSAYDSFCGVWDENDMYKGGGVYAKGTVAFIDGGGGWHQTVTNYNSEVITVIAHSPYFSKKAHCLNSSVQSYWANCYVWQYVFSNCV